MYSIINNYILKQLFIFLKKIGGLVHIVNDKIKGHFDQTLSWLIFTYILDKFKAVSINISIVIR